MADNIKIVSSDAVKPRTRKPPSTVLLESVGDDYKSYRQMSERYGVHIETLRRICKLTDANGEKKVTAPSAAAQQGDLVVYLFTQDDVAEMDAYMETRGYKVKEN